MITKKQDLALCYRLALLLSASDHTFCLWRASPTSRFAARPWPAMESLCHGRLFLLLRSLWGESQRGQDLTTRHPAYAGRIKLPGRIRWLAGTEADKGESRQHDHC
jgi:hypothetical protein